MQGQPGPEGLGAVLRADGPPDPLSPPLRGTHDERTDARARASGPRELAPPPEVAVVQALAAALAPRLAALLSEGAGLEQARVARRFVDAAEVARVFGVDRAWVYAHKEELGALRLGEGRRARLRFDLEQVARALRHREEARRTRGESKAKARKKRGGRRSRPRATGSEVPLIAYEA